MRRRLALAIACLILAGLAAEIWNELLGWDDPFGLVARFGLSYEQNVPTWFSSIELMACAVLLGLIAAAASQRGLPYVRHWWALGWIFAYISCDEVVEIHEYMNPWFDLGGIFHFGWVIPAGIAVAIIGVSYLGFLGHLPARTRNQCVGAGLMYVGGALGVELPLGLWSEAFGDRNFGYALIDLVEESLELCGAAVFLCALLEYFVSPAVRQAVWPQPVSPQPAGAE